MLCTVYTITASGHLNFYNHVNFMFFLFIILSISILWGFKAATCPYQHVYYVYFYRKIHIFNSSSHPFDFFTHIVLNLIFILHLIVCFFTYHSLVSNILLSTFSPLCISFKTFFKQLWNFKRSDSGTKPFSKGCSVNLYVSYVTNTM